MADFTFTEKAMEQYIYWQTQDRKTLKRINSLIADINRNGAIQGIGKLPDSAAAGHPVI